MLLCIRVAGRLEMHGAKLVAVRLRAGRLGEHKSGRCRGGICECSLDHSGFPWAIIAEVVLPWIASRTGVCDNFAASVGKVPAEFRETSGKSVVRWHGHGS